MSNRPWDFLIACYPLFPGPASTLRSKKPRRQKDCWGVGVIIKADRQKN